jgi:hypothetical protein
MTAISGPMPADLAEAVRSLTCGACQAPRGEYCPCDGTHLARWEQAAAAALVSERDYSAAAEAAQPAPPGFPRGLAVVPELSGVVCTAGHPLQWSAGVRPQQWVHLDPAATPGRARPRPCPGRLPENRAATIAVTGYWESRPWPSPARCQPAAGAPASTPARRAEAGRRISRVRGR